MINFKILEKSYTTLKMIVSGVDVTFLNALRRIMLGEVPSMIIHEVIFVDNSSVMHDEVLASRLGLIPLKTDLDSYNLSEECTCKSELGCNLCRAVLTLDVEAKEDVRTVYSGDLSPEDRDIKPVKDNIPVIKLAPGQRLKLEAYARLGKGKVHAKWQPVSLCSYKYLPKITIDLKRCDSCAKCVEVCPPKIIMGGKSIEPVNTVECTLCLDCVDACPLSPPAIEVSSEKDSLIFSVESLGGLPAERIFLEALNIFDGKINDLLNELK